MIKEQEPGNTSSIGPQWPPKETSFDRVKGIDNRGVIRDKERYLEVLGEVGELRDRVIENEESHLDRVSVRLFVQNDVWLSSLSELDGLGEVVIPLINTNPNFNDVSMLYLGANGDTRQVNERELSQCIENAREAMQRDPVSYTEVTSRVLDQGYKLAILRRNVKESDEGVIDQMADLYARFGWEREEVEQILANESNIVAVVFDKEKVVSAGIAETSIVRFRDGNEFRMAEITEAATDENYQGKGLYTAVAAHLMHELAIRSRENEIFGGGIDLAFGECNGNEPGVLKAVRSLGRTFALEISDSWHLPFKGYLPQHVPIAGAPKSTKYNDLFPTYIGRRDIARFIRL